MGQPHEFGDGVSRRVGRDGVVMEPLGNGDLGGETRREEMAAEIEAEGVGREGGTEGGVVVVVGGLGLG